MLKVRELCGKLKWKYYFRHVPRAENQVADQLGRMAVLYESQVGLDKLST